MNCQHPQHPQHLVTIMAPMVDRFPRACNHPRRSSTEDPRSKQEAWCIEEEAIESLVADMYESSAQYPDKEMVAQSIKEYVNSNLLSVPDELSVPDAAENFHKVMLEFNSKRGL